MSPSRKTSSLLSFTPFQVATAVTPTARQPPRPESTISPGAGAVSSPNRCSGSSTTTGACSPTCDSERYWPSITVWTLLVPRLAGLALPLAAKAARPSLSMGRR
ncbi:hypothetical protein D9M69_695130 [compost metagenome]